MVDTFYPSLSRSIIYVDKPKNVASGNLWTTFKMVFTLFGSQDPSFLLTCWLTQLSSQDSGSKYRGPEHVWYARDIKEERSKHWKTENCENNCGLEVNFSYISSVNPSTSRGILNVRQEKGLDTEISLMHMNCEGCEWELLEDLVEDPELVKKVVAVFQTFSFLPNV